MRHLSYAAVLVGCLLATLPLEVVLGVRVYRQWRRLLLTVAPVLVVFLLWDGYAIHVGHWRFDGAQTTGAKLPGSVPVEELAFFVVVPICSVLALEAVRRVRGWRVGDER